MPSSRAFDALVEARQPLVETILDPAEPVVELNPRTRARGARRSRPTSATAENDDEETASIEGRPP